MDFLGQVVAWFTAPEQWSGQNSIPVHLLGHLTLSVLALLVAVVVALPIGLAIGHTGRGAFLAIALANIGRAVPSIAILGIVFPISLRLNLGFGFVPALIGAGRPGHPADRDECLRGAARGRSRPASMRGAGWGWASCSSSPGSSCRSAPGCMLAGVRTAAVQVVATAPLGAVVGGRTVSGTTSSRGSPLSDRSQVFAGALMVAALALLTELAFAWLQRRAVSPGLRGADRPRPSRRARTGVARGADLMLATRDKSRYQDAVRSRC